MNKEFVVNSENAKNSELLLDAVRRGYVEIVDQFLINGANVNCVSTSIWTKNYTPLHIAVEKGYVEVVTLLLSKNADVNAKQGDNITPLHIAAKTDNVGIAELLLYHGAHIHDSTLSQGFTPLHFASERGNLETVELYLNRGADINFISTKDLLTPLHVATKNNHERVVSLLLQRSADFEKEDKDFKTILYYAVDNLNLMIVKDILNYSPDVDNRSYRNLLKSAVKRSGKDSDKIVETLIEYGFRVKRNVVKDHEFLRTAVEKGYLHIVEQLLRNGARVNNSKSGKNDTFLHIAVRNGNKEMITLLLDNGDYVDAKGYRNYTPLHIAVENGYEEIVAMLLSKLADVNANGLDNITPLHIAAQKGYTPIAKLLLTHCACINSFTLRERYTPLHFASDLGNLEAVELYLKNGSDINVTSAKDNLTALHIATKKRNVQVVSWLLLHGAKVDKLDKDEKTILNYAVENGGLKIVEDVLKNSPDINNKSNRNSLETAVNGYGEENKKIVKALVDYGFIVNPEAANNSNFLHKTVEKGYLKIVEDLLKHIVDVNSPKYSGTRTPLHTAVKYKQAEVTKLLIRYNADINAKEKCGKTPIFYAIENGDLKIMHFLLSSGVNVKNDSKLLHLAVQKGFIEVVKTLLEYDVDINASDKHERTALHFSLLKSNYFEFYYDKDTDINIKTVMVEVLLTKGAYVNAQTKHGVTTLHIAVERGFEKIVKVLLENNANVNLGEKSAITPLHIAAKNGNIHITKMLLSKGANVDAKEIDGTTALHTAVLLKQKATTDDYEIVETLLKSGCDINSRNEKGRTPLHIASYKGHENIVKTLLEYGADLNETCVHNLTPLDYAEEQLRNFYNQLTDYDDFDPDRGIHGCELTAEVLKLRIIKMKIANLYLHKNNLRSIMNCSNIRMELRTYYELSDFQNECEEEITRMKSEKIENTNIKFYDILAKHRSSLAICMRNGNVVQALETYDFETFFPIYADMINLQFRKAMQRKQLLTQGNHSCRILFPELLHDCTEKILSYLNDDELRNVSEACKSG